MTETTSSNRDDQHPTRHKRQARLVGIVAALLATAHWCHPPTPDINIFHRNPSGPMAISADSAPVHAT